MITSEYLDNLVQRKIKGESYTSIKEELISKSIEDEKIKEILKNVDRQVLRFEANKSIKAKNTETKITGYVLLIIGLILTLGSSLGLFNIGNYLIIAYGPILAGFGLIVFGYTRSGRAK
jgi:hypothetical protein